MTYVNATETCLFNSSRNVLCSLTASLFSTYGQFISSNMTFLECTFVILTYLSNWLTFIDSAYIDRDILVVGFRSRVYGAPSSSSSSSSLSSSSSKALSNKCFKLNRLESSISLHYKKKIVKQNCEIKITPRRF